MILQYILVDGQPVPEPDMLKWSRWLEDGHRVMLQHMTWHGLIVSTVFLGLDHSYRGGPPVLWETMIFRGPRNQEYQERYTSEEEARQGHWQAFRFAEASPGPVRRERLNKKLWKKYGHQGPRPVKPVDYWPGAEKCRKLLKTLVTSRTSSGGSGTQTAARRSSRSSR